MQYRNKPNVVEAVQVSDILKILRTDNRRMIEWIGDAYRKGKLMYHSTGVSLTRDGQPVQAYVGDYIVKDDCGVLSVYSEDTFKQAFDPIPEEERR